MSFDFKNWCKNEADPEIGFLTKSILKPYGRATAMPPAWELKIKFLLRINFILNFLMLLFYSGRKV